jgi:predicted ATPase
LFIGETSAKDNTNCIELFNILIDKVHKMQTDLVKKGEKNIEDLRFGEEERSVQYNRCCY